MKTGFKIARLTRGGVRAVVCTVMVIAACSFQAWAAENVETLFEKGKQHLKTGNYEQAVRAFSEALNSVEQDRRNEHVVRMARAQAYFGKGDLKRRTDLDEFWGPRSGRGMPRRSATARCAEPGRAVAALKTTAIKTAHETVSTLSLLCQPRITFINVGNFDRPSRPEKAIG
jgi:hypothetical protein